MSLIESDRLSLPGRLQETSIRLAAGELACLIGPNGSGKTSLLHAMAGIGSPGGETRIDGTDLHRSAPAARVRLLSFLPATRDMRWPLRARDLILLGGASPTEAAEIETLLELQPVANRPIDRVSTGERSRILIARALAPKPALLLLDEPTANLDPYWQLSLMAELKHQLSEGRRAALVAMHDLDAAVRFADRILMMDGGRIVADGTPQAVMDDPRVAAVFRIERSEGEWRVFSPQADRRSSP